MKNLEDAYAIRDQFINDKSTEDEPEKSNVEAEVVSMVTVLIYQASSTVSPLSTPILVIDLLRPKATSSITQAPIFVATTTTTTTTTLPPPPQQQSTTESELAARRMFDTGTYKSLPEHVTLYKALEASTERMNKDEFLTEMNKSRKKRHDDQDPPSPLPDSDLSKRRRRDTSTSGSSRPQAPQSSGWKKSDTQDALPSKNIIFMLSNHKESGQALSISKMKDARYLDFGLKLLIPEHILINEQKCCIKSYQKQPNITKLEWDAKRFEYKHDYTIIESPLAVVFPVGNNEWKIIKFNEIYKFRDGTLTNIMEALDYKVKEYKVNRLNSSMNTRIWIDKDVSMSKEFIYASERRLKTRRIFRKLECFVGGRVRDID
nr:hypothetical protein [Tanacetum cinerariifolium]